MSSKTAYPPEVNSAPEPPPPPYEFTELYRTHQKMVRSVLFRLAGPDHLDDLVQETFLRIWKSRSQHRGDSSLKTWIYRIATNVAFDHGRRSKHRHLEIVRDPGQDSPAPHQSDSVAYQDLVRKALAQLGPAHTSVVVLHLMEGLSLAEVATVLEIAKGTVKSRLFHARKQLQEFLAQQGVQV